MKKNGRRMWAVLSIIVLICGMTGCSNKVSLETVAEPDVPQEVQPEIKVENEGQTTEESIIQEEKELQDDMADYGDCVTVSCEITEQPIVWEDAGEVLFQVTTTSEQFQNEFNLSEETTMKKVEKAIGKTAGESFTLWMEGGDGFFGYEYTIQEIVDKPADTVSYGDKVHTTYSMKSRGVDRGGDIFTGEQVIHLVDTDIFLAKKELDYSVKTAESRIKSIIGKGVGDTFRIMQDSPEWSNSYLYTIQQIDKAVAYGDTIKTTLRRTYIPDADRQVIDSMDDVNVELLAPDGTINLAGNHLVMADATKFLREMQGKSIGERVIFSTFTDSIKRNYDITILDVTSGKAADGYYETEALMLAGEENSGYFYDDSNSVSPCYAIVRDTESNMVYEYAGGNGDHYNLVYRYNYETEYDEQGRLIKEIYSGDFEEICEYQYDERGVCTEIKHSYPGSDFVSIDYCDDAGVIIRTEEPDASGYADILEYAYGDGICTQRTVYDSDGKASVWEYDVWGFWIEPEVFEDEISVE